MPVHFSASEMSARKQRLLGAMAARKLDGMLLFAQESHYWLTGYDTFGFCFFQCLYVGADGRVALLTRSADLRQAAAHFEHRGHPDLEGRRGRRSHARSARDVGGSGRARALRRRIRQLWPHPFQRPPARGGARRLRDAGRRLVARAASADDEIGRGDRLCPRGGAPFRPRRPGGDRRDRAGRRRRRHSRGDAQRDLRRRRRLSRQRIHHRLGRRRAALPLQERPAQALPRRSDHARIRRRQPPLSRRDHAHPCRRPAQAAARALPRRRARGARWPARPSSGRAAPQATSSPPMRAFSTRIACRATASTPAAMRSARNSRPPGWTRRCSTSATIFSSRAIRSISCT